MKQRPVACWASRCGRSPDFPQSRLSTGTARCNASVYWLKPRSPDRKQRTKNNFELIGSVCRRENWFKWESFSAVAHPAENNSTVARTEPTSHHNPTSWSYDKQDKQLYHNASQGLSIWNVSAPAASLLQSATQSRLKNPCAWVLAKVYLVRVKEFTKKCVSSWQLSPFGATGFDSKCTCVVFFCMFVIH